MDGVIYVYVIFISLVLFYSTVSNILVIVSVLRFRKLRTVTNVLISNLAVADILLAVLYMPAKLQDVMHSEDYQEGQVVCKLINSVPILLVTSSCYTMVCISFERRRAIITCHKPQMTLTQLFKVIPTIWVSSALVSLPTNFVYAVGYLDNHKNTTNDNSGTDHLYCKQSMPDSFVSVNKYFVLTVSFLIPLCLVFDNYIRLLRFINRRKVFHTSGQLTTASGHVAANGFPGKLTTVSGQVAANGVTGQLTPDTGHVTASGASRQLPTVSDCVTASGDSCQMNTVSDQVTVGGVSGESNGSQTYSRRRQRIKLMKMLVIVATMFAVSWVPYFVMYIYMKATRQDTSKHAGSYVNLLLITMATFSTAYNSVIYVVFNTGFRDAFKKILKCSCKRSGVR